jgi:uncharacterized membrane protein YtjA (UPF0391 family)
VTLEVRGAAVGVLLQPIARWTTARGVARRLHANAPLPNLLASRRVAAAIGSQATTSEIAIVLHYAVIFFVIALIAAVFGFGGIASSAVGIAQVLFLIFLVLAFVSFLVGLTRR